MSESPSSSLASDQVGESPAVDLIGKIMVIIIIVLFMVVVSALAVHIYAKVFRWRRTSQRQSQSQSQSQSRSQVTGLDPLVLKSLPVSVFQPHDSSKENGVECSVCLSELVEGEKLRVLPKCNHGFHVNCIDMWFQSHATCPLCRTLVVASQPQPGDLESHSFPTNVLIWGNQTQITSSSSTTAASLEETTSNNTTSTTSKRDRMLVIDIPGGHGEEEQNSSSSSSSSSSSATATTSRFAEDDLKSPVLRRLRSLRRLLSNNMLNPWTPTSSTQTTTKGEEGHN